LVALPPRALRANESRTPRRCFAGFRARLRNIGVSRGLSADRSTGRRIDVAAKAMFLKRDTLSHWECVIRAANSGFRAPNKSIWTPKNMGFCNFRGRTTEPLNGGHKTETAARIPRAFNIGRDWAVW
jgi:hypothetical protein